MAESKVEENFKEASSIKDYLDHFDSIKTQETYTAYLKKFFNYINKNPDEYVKGNQNYTEDVKNFALTVKNH